MNQRALLSLLAAYLAAVHGSDPAPIHVLWCPTVGQCEVRGVPNGPLTITTLDAVIEALPRNQGSMIQIGGPIDNLKKQELTPEDRAAFTKLFKGLDKHKANALATYFSQIADSGQELVEEGENSDRCRQFAAAFNAQYATAISGYGDLRNVKEVCSELKSLLADMPDDSIRALSANCLFQMFRHNESLGQMQVSKWNAANDVISHSKQVYQLVRALERRNLAEIERLMADPNIYQFIRTIVAYLEPQVAARLLLQAKKEHLAIYHDDYVKEMIATLASDATNRTMLEKVLDADWLKNHARVFVQAMGVHLPTLTEKTLVQVLKHGGCEVLSAEQLDAFLADKTKAAKYLTGDCLKQNSVSVYELLPAKKNLENLPADTLAKLPDESVSFRDEKLLTLNQFKKLPTCRGIRLGGLTDLQLKAVTAPCLAAILEERQGEVPGDLIKSLPVAAIEGLPAEHAATLLPNLDARNSAQLNGKQVTAMLKFTEYCPDAPEGLAHKDAVVSAECFKAMTPPVRNAFLAKKGNSKGYVEGLLLLDASEVAHLKFTLKGTEHAGMAALDVLLGVSEVPQLGSKCKVGPHPCRLITDAGAFKEQKNLVKSVDGVCVSHSGLVYESWDGLEKVERLYGLLPWDTIVKIASDKWMDEEKKEGWEKVPVRYLTDLYEGGVFCRNATGAILDALTADQWAGMTGRCFNQLRSLPQKLDLVPVSAYTHLTSGRAGVIGMERLLALGDAAWAQISREVAAGEGNVGSLLGGLDKWTPERMSVLAPSLLGSLRPSSCATLTVQQMAAIPADSLRQMTRQQVAAMPTEVLQSLTAEQVNLIGIAHAKQTTDPIWVLRDIKFKNSEAAKAAKDRSSAYSFMSKAITVTAVAASAVAMLSIW